MLIANRSLHVSLSGLGSPLLFAAVCALFGCDKGTGQPDASRDLSSTMMNGMEMPSPPDLGPHDLAKPADLLPPPDLTMPFTPIPSGMLGVNVAVNLACDYERRGWMADAMGVCQRTFDMNHTTPVKTIRIDAAGTNKYQITAGKTDTFAMDYQVTTSDVMPDAVYTDGADPVATTRLTHTYELQPRALHVETDLLHDNDTPLPPTVCTAYFYEHTKCAGDLTW